MRHLEIGPRRAESKYATRTLASRSTFLHFAASLHLLARYPRYCHHSLRGEKNYYYGRGCVRALPLGFTGLFHRDCLQADMRRRIQARRKSERAKFERWLRRQRCPECGIGLVEASCEAASLGRMSRGLRFLLPD